MAKRKKSKQTILHYFPISKKSEFIKFYSMALQQTDNRRFFSTLDFRNGDRQFLWRYNTRDVTEDLSWLSLHDKESLKYIQTARSIFVPIEALTNIKNTYIKAVQPKPALRTSA